MANYLDIQKEETLKAHIFRDYFDKADFAYDPDIGNIDFIVTDAKPSAGGLFKTHYFWAEAKKGEADLISMITQLILTCKKTYDSDDYLPPPFIGCFDAVKIAFVPFYDILPVFAESDVNWNVAPSNYLSDDFIKIRKKIAKLIVKKIAVFDFDNDTAEIKNFIKTNFISSRASAKSPITKNNFPHIYYRWVKEVKPAINVSADRWLKYKKEGILDCDFFRADMMSKGGTTITDRLKIVLENDKYKLQKDIEGELFKTEICFTDDGTAYRQFWNKYERPPADEYQQYIIDRRDLLIPQNIREIKGSFFTPRIWVEKSQEYLEKVFGVNWQEEYYVWDCAAGTGNLLAGLVNKYNIWASTIDQPDVDTIHAMIEETKNSPDEEGFLLHAHVFQFDFLNDIITQDDEKWINGQRAKIGQPPVKRKLPPSLTEIIDDPEKRKKLIVYINPPYAEAGNQKMPMGGGNPKTGVSIENRTKDKYAYVIGAATNELSAQFMARIYHEISGGQLAIFSKLKFVCTQNFIKFRRFFNADYKGGFVVRSNTFDNVQGNFPIAFTIWNLSGKRFPEYIDVDIPEDGGQKRYWDDFYKSINHWIRTFNHSQNENIGLLICESPDFQKIHQPYITLLNDVRKSRQFFCSQTNLFISCIYFSVRLCIEPIWLNDRDQFLFPSNDGWETDAEFKHDCLIFTLFHGQNRISSAHGINHWIPFSEQQVNAQEKFNSHFMNDFLKEKTFSPEAQAVLDSGLELWKYYHAKIKGKNTVSVNASFYDIREYFQGRKENGKMNNTSADEIYNNIIKTLRNNLKELAEKIEPKVYEYGFLK